MTTDSWVSPPFLSGGLYRHGGTGRQNPEPWPQHCDSQGPPTSTGDRTGPEALGRSGVTRTRSVDQSTGGGGGGLGPRLPSVPCRTDCSLSTFPLPGRETSEERRRYLGYRHSPSRRASQSSRALEAPRRRDGGAPGPTHVDGPGTPESHVTPNRVPEGSGSFRTHRRDVRGLLPQTRPSHRPVPRAVGTKGRPTVGEVFLRWC